MYRRRNFFSSFTIWLVLAAIILAVLEIMPVPGIIFMMFNIAFNLNVMLLYLIIIGFIVDCLIGPFPRLLILVPILGLGGFALWYESQYNADRAALPQIEAELQSRNISVPVPFDPATESMVSPNHRLMLDYRIPIVYQPNRISPLPDKFIAFAIRPRQGCNVFSKANPTGTDFSDYVGGTSLICITRSEVTTLPATRFEIQSKSSTETIAGHDVTLNTQTLLVDGVPQATYTSGYTNTVPPWPNPQLGCYLNDNPAAWLCVHALGKERVTLDSVPGAGTPADTNANDMLIKVHRRTPDEVAALTAK